MNILKEIGDAIEAAVNGTVEQRWQQKMDNRAQNLEPFLIPRLDQFKEDNEGHTYDIKYADHTIQAVDHAGRPVDYRNLIQVVLDAPDKQYTGLIIDLTHPMYGGDTYINIIMDQVEEMINTHLENQRHVIF